MSTRTGQLRHRVTFQKSSVVQADGLGGGTRAYTNVATVWARVTPAQGFESAVGGGLRGRITHNVTIRYPLDFTVTPDMQLVWNNRTLVIKGIVQPEVITQWLILNCQEGE